jgi:DNA primase
MAALQAEINMLIDKAEIERVKRANDLMAVVRSRGVKLTRRGKQLVGLCPFHEDHEPSFIVDPKKQLWNCLGACNEGGDGKKLPQTLRKLDRQPRSSYAEHLSCFSLAAF